MSNFLNELNIILKNRNLKLNNLYKDEDNCIVKQALKICELKPTKTAKIAVLRRIVDLKSESLINELKNLKITKEKIDEIVKKMYDFCADFHCKLHEEMIEEIKQRDLLDSFNLAILEGFHKIGLKMNEFFKAWELKVVDENAKYFKERFEDIGEAREYLNENDLNFKNPDGTICDRSYGSVFLENGKLILKTYAAAFPNEIKKIEADFNELLQNLEKTKKSQSDEAYYEYFKALKIALLELDCTKAVQRWQEAEIKWMNTKSFLQIGHFLEYYEDIYTKSVAPEWDIRLIDSLDFDATSFKAQFKKSFDQVYQEIGAKNENMQDLVKSSIDETQLYISNPFIYYGADLNGLFSAQVVPNDEFVSKKCGKKIFAFINFIYESAKSRPFTRLSAEILDRDFLNYTRDILFNKPQVWKRVYELSTIGHEFGHILFVDEQSETLMNKSGVYKYVEEYKATAGGQINFFLNEIEEYKMPLFSDIIARNISLIARQKVEDVKAYYCEGLIGLDLLFKSKTLSFKDGKLTIDFSVQSYERFKNIALSTFNVLAWVYANKKDSNEFLSKFCRVENEIYLPKESEVCQFVKFYHKRFEEIGNEIVEDIEFDKC